MPPILAAAVSIFMAYLKTGTRLYGDKPSTYTRCQEKWDKDWQLVIGGFAAGGLSAHYNNRSAFGNLSVGALRKL